jgi:hypothetical protein
MRAEATNTRIFLQLALLVMTLALSTACSTQYRDALPQVSQEELTELFDDIAQNSQTNDPIVTALAQSDDLFVGEYSTIMYHARDEAGRPPASVFSVTDMSLFGWDLAEPSYRVLDLIDVIFVDAIDSENERRFALMLRMEGVAASGEKRVFYFTGSSESGDYSFSDDEFEVRIFSAEGVPLLLRSTDLSGQYEEELASSVKFEIYIDDGSADGAYVGQISTMAGYGNR